MKNGEPMVMIIMTHRQPAHPASAPAAPAAPSAAEQPSVIAPVGCISRITRRLPGCDCLSSGLKYPVG